MRRTLEELGLDRLSREEKLQVAEELLVSANSEYEDTPLTPAQIAELDRRLSTPVDPKTMKTWEQVKQELRENLARCKSA